MDEVEPGSLGRCSPEAAGARGVPGPAVWRGCGPTSTRLFPGVAPAPPASRSPPQAHAARERDRGSRLRAAAGRAARAPAGRGQGGWVGTQGGHDSCGSPTPPSVSRKRLHKPTGQSTRGVREGARLQTTGGAAGGPPRGRGREAGARSYIAGRGPASGARGRSQTINRSSAEYLQRWHLGRVRIYSWDTKHWRAASPRFVRRGGPVALEPSPGGDRRARPVTPAGFPPPEGLSVLGCPW